MNHREHYNLFRNNSVTEEEAIMKLVNGLIEALYVPVLGDRMTHIDKARLKRYQIDHSEPANWGSLGCNEVKKFDDGTFLVTLEEACPDECQTLCEFIEKYMKSYGWEVKVQTEW